MLDVAWGIAVVLALAVGAFFGALRLGRRATPRIAAVAVAVVAAATVGFAVFVVDHPLLVALLPFSNVIVLGNWLPVGCGALAGLAWARIEGRGALARRIAATALLAGGGAFVLVEPLVGARPHVRGDVWADGVCLQSSDVTCSAAAAATLLRAHGVARTEAEMAALCLTDEDGTTLHGTWRGLVLATSGTGLAPRVERWTLDELLAEGAGPAIISVVLEPDAVVDPRYEAEWGWRRGEAHAVVFFRRVSDDRVEIGDPSVGREPWTVDDLRVLWHGRAVRLVPR